MMRFVRNPADAFTGLVLVMVALFAWWAAADLRTGTALQMGPGYFPKLLCMLQLGLGLLVFANGLVVTQTVPLEPVAVRPLVLVLASIVYFGVAIERVGVAVAVFGLVLIAGLAHRGLRPIPLVTLAAGLAIFAVLLFIKVLGLTMMPWPWSR